MAVWMYAAALLSLLLEGEGATFNFMWCSDAYATDTSMTTSQAEAKLSSLGPLKLVLADGGREDTSRSCSVLDLDMSAGTYSFSYTENGARQTKQGAVELTKGPPSFIVLRGIGLTVLGGDCKGDAKLFIMSVDDSELVLLNCFNRFVFHLEYLYVFSNTYESSSLSEVCSVDTVKEMFGVTAILQQETC